MIPLRGITASWIDLEDSFYNIVNIGFITCLYFLTINVTKNAVRRLNCVILVNKISCFIKI